MLCKKAVIPDQKYMLHSADNLFGKLSDHNSVKDGQVGPMGISYEAMKQWKKSENKWKKDLKAIKKQNNIIYSIAKNNGSRREIKKIQKTKAKAYNKRRYYSSDSFSDKSDSNYSLSRNSDWDEDRRTYGRR